VGKAGFGPRSDDGVLVAVAEGHDKDALLRNSTRYVGHFRGGEVG
jgi:hypothetical protein